ncbi:MAG: beta galactosidase jelly roll domain-containing protein [Phycisphaerales bacterium]|nr:beta galactosidase jelly roll domain-containing protein [Phycisphaerales bacterium]
MERALQAGVKFDIAVDSPMFKPEGYRTIIRVLENGKVTEQINDLAPQTYDAPRSVNRPDLGALPQISVNAQRVGRGLPATLQLKAVPIATIGELAVDLSGAPLVYWEIFTPDGDVVMLDGPEQTYTAGSPGLYRLRASTVDVFGRPAHTWSQIDLGGKAIAAFPAEWNFSIDPDNQGESQGWYRERYNDAKWIRLPVPGFWEDVVGPYDGYGWYRVQFTLTTDMIKQPLAIFFQGVDEEAWVYLNGQLIGERTVESTGRPPVDIWDKSFKVPLGRGMRAGRNTLVVKVHDQGQAGGIYGPVMILIDEP